MEQANPLGEDKIIKLLIRFSVPAIVGMLVNSLYNIVDRIFIGNSEDLGYNGIAGITLGFPIMIILLAFGILFGIGGSTLFSIRLGQKRSEDAEKALGNAFVMLVVFGLLFMVGGQIFLKPLLTLFGASDDVLPYAMEYMRTIFFGAGFQVVSMGMNNFIRADGNPNIAMLTMFVGAGTNILLDPLFIYGFRMGMTGAALATVLSQMISFTWVLSYFLGKRSHIRLKVHNMKPRLHIILKIVALGLPGFLLQLANSLLNAILNKTLLAYGGDIAISVMGIIHSLQTILVMPVIGLRQGAQPIISFNYGARKYRRVREAALWAILFATLIVVVGYIVTRFFPEQMIRMFNDDPSLVELGKKALLSWFLCFPVVGFQIIGSNYFQSIGKPRSAMFLTLTRQVILLIPAILLFPRYWGLDGLLYAAPFADLFSAVLTGVWFFVGMRRLGKEAKKERTVV